VTRINKKAGHGITLSISGFGKNAMLEKAREVLKMK